jgi:hypothetical protein
MHTHICMYIYVYTENVFNSQKVRGDEKRESRREL